MICSILRIKVGSLYRERPIDFNCRSRDRQYKASQMRLPCLFIECFVKLLGLFKDSLACGSEGGGAAHVDRARGRCTKGAKVTGKGEEEEEVRRRRGSVDQNRGVSRRGRERSPVGVLSSYCIRSLVWVLISRDGHDKVFGVDKLSSCQWHGFLSTDSNGQGTEYEAVKPSFYYGAGNSADGVGYLFWCFTGPFRGSWYVGIGFFKLSPFVHGSTVCKYSTRVECIHACSSLRIVGYQVDVAERWLEMDGPGGTAAVGLSAPGFRDGLTGS